MLCLEFLFAVQNNVDNDSGSFCGERKSRRSSGFDIIKVSLNNLPRLPLYPSCRTESCRWLKLIFAMAGDKGSQILRLEEKQSSFSIQGSTAACNAAIPENWEVLVKRLRAFRFCPPTMSSLVLFGLSSSEMLG